MDKAIIKEMQEAKSCGLSRFWSKVPCEVCRCETRDTETGACVDCMMMAYEKTTAHLRRQATLFGFKYFIGRKCSKCGDVHKYTSNRSCVSCTNANARQKYRSNPERSLENTRRWREINKEYFRDYQRARGMVKKEVAANKSA